MRFPVNFKILFPSTIFIAHVDGSLKHYETDKARISADSFLVCEKSLFLSDLQWAEEAAEIHSKGGISYMNEYMIHVRNLVSKGTLLPHWWGSDTRKFVIKRVEKGQIRSASYSFYGGYLTLNTSFDAKSYMIHMTV